MKKFLLSLGLLIAASSGIIQAKENYYVKHLTFPEGISLNEKVEMASRLVPSRQQAEWQKLEMAAFIHFGINTFTDREWGDGSEDPKLFNPTELDADQWVRTLSEAGFKIVILTAKHHDGFCLWPTATTSHSVASSPWKNGKGDVVKELREACDKYGMKFGVYLSPWDRNATCYGDSPKYNEFFIRQLTELLTNYGEVHEVWFDGANGEGPNGRKQEYDWDAFYATIKKYQPNAVMAIMGDDVRWVGNEKGIGRETEWSATVITPGIYANSDKSNKALGITQKSSDLGSREMLADAKDLYWYPSEVDVSIRPGWFYHQYEDNSVKSLKHLSDIYFQSVGYNSVLLLNIPPDRRGLIHENDVKRLKEFADYRNKVFATDFVRKGGSYWKAKPGDSRVYRLNGKSTINMVMLQEDILKGQRVEKFTVEAQTGNGEWKEVATGTTVGYKRIVRFPEVKAEAIRINIMGSRNTANITKVAAYAAPTIEEAAIESKDGKIITNATMLKSAPLTLDLGSEKQLTALTYAPASKKKAEKLAYHYTVSISTDGSNWTDVIVNGEFGNIMHNPQPQTVSFGKTVNARYIRIAATSFDNSEADIESKEFSFFLK